MRHFKPVSDAGGNVADQLAKLAQQVGQQDEAAAGVAQLPSALGRCGSDGAEAVGALNTPFAILGFEQNLNSTFWASSSVLLQEPLPREGRER